MVDFKTDNFANTMSSLGGLRDKATGAEYRRRKRLTRQTIDVMYNQSELCAKAVDRIVGDAMAESPWSLAVPGWEPEQTTAYQASAEKDLHLSERVTQAAKWSRKYGACALLLPIRDGRKPSEPVDIAAIEQVTAPSSIPAHQIRPKAYDSAFGSPSYREFLSYEIQALSSAEPQRVVHADRVIMFEAIPQALETRLESLGIAGGSAWGPSVIQRFLDEFLREGSSRGHANAMLYTASLLVLQLQGIGNKMTTDEGRSEIRQSLNAIREALDTSGLLGIDASDKLVSVSRSFAGVPDILAADRDALGAALPFPRVIGMNEAQTGLRGGELSGEQALWFAQVRTYRTDQLAPVLLQLLRLYSYAQARPLPADAAIEWKPLWVPNETTQSETAHTNAKTDEIYRNMRVLGEKEIRGARFVEQTAGPIVVSGEQEIRKQSMYMEPALRIVEAVTAGKIPRDAGELMLAAGGFDVTLIGSAGR